MNDYCEKFTGGFCTRINLYCPRSYCLKECKGEGKINVPKITASGRTSGNGCCGGKTTEVDDALERDAMIESGLKES
jgi:hypothetical protein